MQQINTMILSARHSLFLLGIVLRSPCISGFSLGGAKRQSPRLISHHLRSASTISEQDETSLPITSAEFTTAPMTVYIEDTDAYGIMYNGNYLRCYDRALHMTSYASSSSSTTDIVLKHDDEWSIVSLRAMKFKVPPALGASFVITGKLVEQPSVYEQVWDLEMKSGDDDNAIVFNTALGVRIAHAPPPPTTDANGSQEKSTCSWIPQPPPLELTAPPSSPSSKAKGFVCAQLTDSFQVFRDEFDSHLPTHLPLRSLLNLFERSRTNALGGPQGGLGRLQSENGIIAVVTNVDHCSLVSYDDNDDNDAADLDRLIAGNSLTTTMDSIVKRGGAVIEFHQTAILGKKRLGQAVIKTCLVYEQTGRPVKKGPAWLEERLLGFAAEQSKTS